jgi:hypothetical protein
LEITAPNFTLHLIRLVTAFTVDDLPVSIQFSNSWMVVVANENLRQLESLKAIA